MVSACIDNIKLFNQIQITDMLGKVLVTKQIEMYNGLGYIDADLVAGNYILNIQKSATESVNKKLVIIQ
jgi:hypothetical protein